MGPSKSPSKSWRGRLTSVSCSVPSSALGPRVKASPEEGDAERGRQTLTALIDRALVDLLSKAKSRDEGTRSDDA